RGPPSWSVRGCASRVRGRGEQSIAARRIRAGTLHLRADFRSFAAPILGVLIERRASLDARRFDSPHAARRGSRRHGPLVSRACVNPHRSSRGISSGRGNRFAARSVSAPGRSLAPPPPLNAVARWRTAMTLKACSFTAAVALLALTLAGNSTLGQTRTLYDRLGGYPGISAVVDDFVKNVAADKRINKFFANANIDRLKARLVEQICQGTGGPCVYTGRDMKSVHAGMGIRGKDF